MGYIRKAVEGFSWQTVLKIISSLVILAKISVLARILTPEDFGLFSLAIIALGISEAAAQTGVNITMLQSKRSVSYFIDTAWVISIARGLLIAIVMLLIGFGLQAYFQLPTLMFLVALASLVPIIKGFINPAIIGLRKDLRFFWDSTYRLSLVVAESILAIALGLWLKSVTAMIWSIIGAALFEVIISHLFFQLKPKFRYLKSRAQIIFHHARWLSLASILGYLNDNLDDLVVGRVTNTHQLGIYTNAYSLTHKANYDLARSVHHGTLPILTKIVDNKTRLNRAISRTFGGTILLMLVTAVPFFLFPDFIVNLILGDQWLAAIPLLKWLVVAGSVHGFALLGYTLFLATGAYRAMNAHQLSNLILTISFIIYGGLQSGLIGAVIGLTLGRVLALPIIAYGIYRQTRTS